MGEGRLHHSLYGLQSHPADGHPGDPNHRQGPRTGAGDDHRAALRALDPVVMGVESDLRKRGQDYAPMTMLPYAATVVVLVIISRNRMLLRSNTPACLG